MSNKVYGFCENKCKKEVAPKDYVDQGIGSNKQTLGYQRKNLIPYPYVNTTKTTNGITWTDDGTGMIVASGTVSALDISVFYLRSSFTTVSDENKLILSPGKYIISGCPSGGSDTTWQLTVYKKINDGTLVYLTHDYGDGAEFSLDTDTEIEIDCSILEGIKVSNLTFKPMIRYAGISDNTWEPYVPDVDTRLTDVDTRVKELESSLNGLGYSHQDLLNLTTAYESIQTNGLKFNGKYIYPAAYANSVFLIILNDVRGAKVASAYIVMMDEDISLISCSRISPAPNDNVYPVVAISASGYAYVRWAALMGDLGDVKASIFKLA